MQQTWLREQAARTGSLQGKSRTGVSVRGDGQVHVRRWERAAEMEQERRSVETRESKNPEAEGWGRSSNGY